MEEKINEIKYHIGIRIKALRKRNNLSQTDLADKAGVSKAIISAYEKNVRTPSVDVLIKFSLIFDVPIGIFFYKVKEEEIQNVNVSGLTHSQIAIIEAIIRSFRNEN